MKRAPLSVYEYAEGYPLHRVDAYQCEKFREIFFTEKDAERMEERTKELVEREFAFDRKITISGGSMVVSIPHELTEHLNLKRGQRVKVVPVAKRGFLVKTRAESKPKAF